MFSRSNVSSVASIRVSWSCCSCAGLMFLTRLVCGNVCWGEVVCGFICCVCHMNFADLHTLL